MLPAHFSFLSAQLECENGVCVGPAQLFLEHNNNNIVKVPEFGIRRPGAQCGLSTNRS